MNHETIHAEGMDLECWDIGGLDKMRPLWRQYSRDSDAFIFVVDTADLPRMKLAADELAKLYGMTSQRDSLHHDRPLLIFANKQDLPTAAPEHLVAHVLGLSALPVHVSKIFPCTANDRQSLQKGIVWLTDQLKNKKPISASSV